MAPPAPKPAAMRQRVVVVVTREPQWLSRCVGLINKLLRRERERELFTNMCLACAQAAAMRTHVAGLLAVSMQPTLSLFTVTERYSLNAQKGVGGIRRALRSEPSYIGKAGVYLLGLLKKITTHYKRRPDLISKRLQCSKMHSAHPNRRGFIHGITNPTVRMDRSRDTTNWIHNCLARGKASCQLAAPWSTTLPFAGRDPRWRTSCSSSKFQSAASGHTRLHPHSRCRDDPRESPHQEL